MSVDRPETPTPEEKERATNVRIGKRKKKVSRENWVVFGGTLMLVIGIAALVAAFLYLPYQRSKEVQKPLAAESQPQPPLTPPNPPVAELEKQLPTGPAPAEKKEPEKSEAEKQPAVVQKKVRHGWTGTPLMEGLKNPSELALLVEHSLEIDSTGDTLLDPARCKRDGSCATARDYLEGIKREHPNSQLGDVADLPRYLRSLVKQPAPDGEWHMSRLRVRGEEHTYDAEGWHRAFFKKTGEAVWDDANTGEHILAGTCGNVVGKLVSPVPVVSICPNGRTLIARAYSMQTLPGDLHDQAEDLIKKAGKREGTKKEDGKSVKNPEAYRGASLSRSMGEPLYRRASPTGELDVQVRLLDPKTFEVSENLGSIHLVGGIGSTPLTEDQRNKVVQMIWPVNFRSPVASESLTFGDEWGDHCSLIVSGVAP